MATLAPIGPIGEDGRGPPTGAGNLGLAMHMLRKPTNEAAMCLQINQIKSESDFAYCRFRGGRKGCQGPRHGLWRRVGTDPGKGRTVRTQGMLRAQPGLQLSHDVL